MTKEDKLEYNRQMAELWRSTEEAWQRFGERNLEKLSEEEVEHEI